MNKQQYTIQELEDKIQALKNKPDEETPLVKKMPKVDKNKSEHVLVYYEEQCAEHNYDFRGDKNHAFRLLPKFMKDNNLSIKDMESYIDWLMTVFNGGYGSLISIKQLEEFNQSKTNKNKYKNKNRTNVNTAKLEKGIVEVKNELHEAQLITCPENCTENQTPEEHKKQVGLLKDYLGCLIDLSPVDSSSSSYLQTDKNHETDLKEIGESLDVLSKSIRDRLHFKTTCKTKDSCSNNDEYTFE